MARTQKRTSSAAVSGMFRAARGITRRKPVDVTVTEARPQLAGIVRRAAAGQTTYLTKRGKGRIAAVVPIADAELLERLYDKRDTPAIDAALARRAVGEEPISWEQLKAELDADDHARVA